MTNGVVRALQVIENIGYFNTEWSGLRLVHLTYIHRIPWQLGIVVICESPHSCPHNPRSLFEPGRTVRSAAIGLSRREGGRNTGAGRSCLNLPSNVSSRWISRSGSPDPSHK